MRNVIAFNARERSLGPAQNAVDRRGAGTRKGNPHHACCRRQRCGHRARVDLREIGCPDRDGTCRVENPARKRIPPCDFRNRAPGNLILGNRRRNGHGNTDLAQGKAQRKAGSSRIDDLAIGCLHKDAAGSDVGRLVDGRAGASINLVKNGDTRTGKRHPNRTGGKRA